MAILDVIRFDGLKSRNWLIFKSPKSDIVLGSQLIVQEGQIAIFVKGGTVCDVFYPGTYTIESKNLPILSKLVNLPFGGETPFSAEIYFVNTITKLDVNWGTTDPIQLIDPKYFVKLRIRAFGTMGIKLLDPTTFFKELIGGMNPSEIVQFDKLEEFYRGILVLKVKSLISEAIISNQISALEISTKLEELSDNMKEAITKEFAPYGINVINFIIQSINFPDDDFEKINKILEDKAAFEIMGDNRYVTKRSFDVYEGAANNQNGVAGAFAAGGVGMGAAMGMGMAMNNVMGNPMMGTSQQPTQPAPEAMMECPSCHASTPQNGKFCMQCGYSFANMVCSCGAKLVPGAKFCLECGKKVGE